MYFPPDAFQDAPHLETKKCLLIVDLQNDFATAGGKLPVENIQDFLPKLPNLVSQFRGEGEIVWVRTEFVEPRPSISEDLGCSIIVLEKHLAKDGKESASDLGGSCYPDPATLSWSGPDDPEAFLAPKALDQKRCCLPASPGIEFPQIIASAVKPDRDIILTKTCYSAFHEGSLLPMLRAKLITELYLCGSLSNISVYATALDAVRHGLAVTIVEDCVGYRNEKCHEEAMRYMADAMGADGVEYQELMDELRSNMNDSFNDDHTHRELSPHGQTVDESQGDLPLRPKVHGWLDSLNDQVAQADVPNGPCGSNGTGYTHLSWNMPEVAKGTLAGGYESPSGRESYVTANEAWPDAPEPSTPLRKRSTGHRDLQERKSKLIDTNPSRRASHGANPEQKARTKAIRVRTRHHVSTEEQDETTAATRNVGSPSTMEPRAFSQTPPTSFLQAHDAIAQTTGGYIKADPNADSITSENENMSSMLARARAFTSKVRRSRRRNAKATLGPGDPIGEGDSRIRYDFIPDYVPAEGAAQVYNCLKDEVKWQKMYQRSGEVPRLVAVQGEIRLDGSIPIYRHPADESPPLLAFSPMAQSIREHVEQEVRHPINHVLIQLYRSGEDNISEHSDKTLDIMRGSAIVNYSVGALRTMTLRTKKAAPIPQSSGTQQAVSSDADLVDGDANKASASQPVAPPAENLQRTSQRIPMPHNSLFILGQATNQNWLHSVRADKRPVQEQSVEELAFNSERISLTFRYIGTFIDPATNTIWGQGAVSKEKSRAGIIPTGTEAEREGETLIRAFGRENHQSREFNWDEHYGAGFDVVNFVTKDQPD